MARRAESPVESSSNMALINLTKMAHNEDGPHIVRRTRQTRARSVTGLPDARGVVRHICMLIMCNLLAPTLTYEYDAGQRAVGV